MRISIDWGADSVLRFEADEREQHQCANELARMCDERGSDLLVFTTEDTPQVRDLYNRHLVHLRFSMFEQRGEQNTTIKLLYRRKGWEVHDQ